MLVLVSGLLWWNFILSIPCLLGFVLGVDWVVEFWCLGWGYWVVGSAVGILLFMSCCIGYSVESIVL